MQENKAKFELAAKMYKALKIPHEYTQLMRNLDNVERDIWRRVFFTLVFHSVIPISLGLYLMSPNNIFCEYTFPSIRKPESEPAVNDHFQFAFANDESENRPFALGAISREDTTFTKTSNRQG